MIFQVDEELERTSILRTDGRSEISIEQLIYMVTYSVPRERTVTWTDTTSKRESIIRLDPHV